MCGCELKIITESGGESSVFQAEGVFESKADGESVRYPIEGDEGEIFFSEGFFQTCRHGRCNLEAEFSEGKLSEILIGDSSLAGKIPVKTTRYRIQKGETERRIELCYDLLGSENIQSFSLKIQILFFSEEK